MGPSPLVLPAESPMVEAKHDLTHLTDTERLEKLFTPPFFPFLAAARPGG
jgi:hypothetical protein